MTCNLLLDIPVDFNLKETRVFLLQHATNFRGRENHETNIVIGRTKKQKDGSKRRPMKHAFITSFQIINNLFQQTNINYGFNVSFVLFELCVFLFVCDQICHSTIYLNVIHIEHAPHTK